MKSIEDAVTSESLPVSIDRVNGLDADALERIRADFPDHHWKLESANEFLADKNNFLITSKDAERVVGILIGHRLARLDAAQAQVLLYEIDVHPDFRKRGIGSAMIQELKNLAKESGASEVWVITNKSNEAAMQLYEATGGTTKHDDDVVFDFKL